MGVAKLGYDNVCLAMGLDTRSMVWVLKWVGGGVGDMLGNMRKMS